MEQMLDEMHEAAEELLPEELQAELDRRKEAKLQKIEQIAQTICKKRDAAIAARASSGIEQEWLDAEEAYAGIDDANREEAKVLKPATLGGSLVGARTKTPTGSTVFLNITRPYTDAASARVGDMLMPTDDKNWGFKPTPIPELDAKKDDLTPVAGFEVAPPPALPGEPQAPVRPATVADFVAQKQAEARKKADVAEMQVDDWLTQCQYHAEMRKVIDDCARLGTGVLKGPVPVWRKQRKVTQGAEGIELTQISTLDPASKWVSVWNCYPDPAGGDDIQAGSYFVETDKLTAHKVRELKGLPGYLDEQIDAVLEEGPQKKGNMPSNAGGLALLDDDRFDVCYFYGTLEKDDLAALDCECEHDSVPVIVTLINDRPVKAAFNPLDSGDFPYDFMPWQAKADSPWGSGVPHQIRPSQRIINAATRNMMDNAGLAGGPILAVRRNMITPADGDWIIKPRKIFFVSEDADARSVSDAITSIVIPAMTNELMAVIQFALKMAEDVTGLPMILQGQLGKAPDTVGGMQMLQNNAGSVLRRIAKMFDDKITRPHMRRYYDWLMTYSDNEDAKGDFLIDARGSSTLVERDLQNQNILQMGAMVMNPAFGLSPSKWVQEALRSQKLDPKRFELDDEEKAKMAQQQPAPPPQVQAAQIRAQATIEAKKIDQQTDMAKVQADTDRDRVYVEAETERTQAEHSARMAELGVKRELALLDYANRERVSLEQIRADLASDVMRLTTQKELAGANNALKAAQVATPAVEPPGRAPNGEAFQR